MLYFITRRSKHNCVLKIIWSWTMCITLTEQYQIRDRLGDSTQLSKPHKCPIVVNVLPIKQRRSNCTGPYYLFLLTCYYPAM